MGSITNGIKIWYYKSKFSQDDAPHIRGSNSQVFILQVIFLDISIHVIAIDDHKYNHCYAK